jgi:hypothetical protein
MKFKELFTDVDGLLTVFNERHPEQYEKFFSGVDPQSLNAWTLGVYGNRTLIDFINTDTWKDHVATCIELNLFNWERTYNAISQEYGVLVTLSDRTTETRTTSGETSTQNESLDADKVFNDDNFTDNGRRTETGKRNESVSNNYDSVRVSDVSRDTVVKSIQKEIELRQFNFARGVVTMLVNDITCQIYE